MATKFVVAGLLASMALAGSSSLALASSCGGSTTNGSVSCDSFDLFANTNAVVAAQGNQGKSLADALDLTSSVFDSIRQAAATMTSGTLFQSFSTSNALTFTSAPPAGVTSLTGEIARTFSLAFEIQNNKIVSGFVQSVATKAVTTYSVDGGAHTQQTIATASQLRPGITLDVSAMNVAVPGPEAGAGLGALTMGGMALFIMRRRKGADA